jgi:glycosyltransferase involved in cell wall biosynthesis
VNEVDVSVVMGVYNGEGTLAATLASVLEQQDCRLEFIVVDDGSTDASPAILDEWAARDARLRVIHQANTGLTIALARGCAQARGRFIARQDCGDVSLPGRLALLQRFLEQHPDVVMAACAVRLVGPGNEFLFESAREGHELHDGLGNLDVHEVKGPPHHGATMFTRAAYLKAGGYRSEFPVAQDLDLWLRLRELGPCVGLAQVGYEAKLEAASISARRRDEQLQLAALAIECARARSRGEDEVAILGAPRTRVSRGAQNRRLERARFFYFIASCLRKNDTAAARGYYWRAFKEHPLLVKGLLRYLLG